MFNNKKFIAIIPARGGSKGIPDKNITLLNGMPLICYTINAALQSKYIDRVVVSTDSPKIASVCKENGADVPFFRPEELAGDTSKTIDALADTIKRLEADGEVYDYVVLLQPTSPLRKAKHVDGAIEELMNKDFSNIVSVSLVSDNPLLTRTIDTEMNLKNILNETSTVRRQDFKQYFKINGAIYINTAADIKEGKISLNDNSKAYVMKSADSIDIDDINDLVIAEMVLQGKLFKD